MNWRRRFSYYLLKQDIRRHGIIAPVLVDEEGRVLDGNRRVAACISLGLPVPVAIVPVQHALVDATTLILSCPVDAKAKGKNNE